MNFEEALPLLREGKALTRLCWKDKHQHVTLENNTFYKVVNCQAAHYTHAKLAFNPTPNDLLGTDWTVLK